MCVVSNVFDHFEPNFPDPFDPFSPWRTKPNQPYTIPHVDPDDFKIPRVEEPVITPEEVAELKKLIREFRDALAHAKELDRLMKQKDCEDPDKAKLLDRVTALEKRIEELEGQRASAPVEEIDGVVKRVKKRKASRRSMSWSKKHKPGDPTPTFKP